MALSAPRSRLALNFVVAKRGGFALSPIALARNFGNLYLPHYNPVFVGEVMVTCWLDGVEYPPEDIDNIPDPVVRGKVQGVAKLEERYEKRTKIVRDKFKNADERRDMVERNTAMV